GRRRYRPGAVYIGFVVYTDGRWEAFFRFMGRAEQSRPDPGLGDPAARSRHFAEAYTLIADVLATRTTAEWLAAFQADDIPATPMHDLDALIDDPHLAAIGFFHEIDHPTEGRIRVVGIPSRWGRTRPASARHPPSLGETPVEVLREIGLRPAAIRRPAAAGAVGTPDLAAGEPQRPRRKR